jgi:L-amino acid N-acyltransferase YncA
MPWPRPGMTPTGWSSPLWESNPRHQPYHGCALPTELRGRYEPVRGTAADRRVSLAAVSRISAAPIAANPQVTRTIRRRSLRWRPVATPTPPISVRPATGADAGAIAEIYNREVTTSTATFDLVERSIDEQRAWLAARSGAFAAIVAVDSATKQVVGFASLSPYKERAAYHTTVENSVYVHRDHGRRGIGRLLMEHLIAMARESGFHSIIARIEATGEASRALHAACGFELVGIERQVGRKFRRWLDVAVMQKMLD